MIPAGTDGIATCDLNSCCSVAPLGGTTPPAGVCPSSCQNGCDSSGNCKASPNIVCSPDCLYGCDSSGNCKAKPPKQVCPTSCQNGCDANNLCNPAPCASGQFDANGNCVTNPTCKDQCSAGVWFCVGTGYIAQCADTNGDGCSETPTDTAKATKCALGCITPVTGDLNAYCSVENINNTQNASILCGEGYTISNGQCVLTNSSCVTGFASTSGNGCIPPTPAQGISIWAIIGIIAGALAVVGVIIFLVVRKPKVPKNGKEEQDIF